MTSTTLKISKDKLQIKIHQTLTGLLFSGAIKPNIFVVIASICMVIFFYTTSGNQILYWCGYMLILAISCFLIFHLYKKNIATQKDI